MTTKRRTVTFESATCSRCGGDGRYPSSAYNGVCLGCYGTGKKLTRRGAAARKAYDAVMAEMEVPAESVVVGDLVQVTVDMAGSKRWEPVLEILANSGVGYTGPDGETVWHPGIRTKSARLSFSGQGGSTIRRWSAEVRERAFDRVARMAGATVTAPESPVAAPEPAAPVSAPATSRRTSHAECDHAATPRDRAACRKARKNA